MEALSTATGHSPSLAPSHRNTVQQRLPGLLPAFHLSDRFLLILFVLDILLTELALIIAESTRGVIPFGRPNAARASSIFPSSSAWH